MNPQILRRLLSLLTAVRLGDFRDQFSHGLRVGSCLGFSSALYEAGLITREQEFLLDDLALNAGFHAGEPFPAAANAGPVMPLRVELERKQSVKLPAQDSANEKPEPVPAPTPRRELRLLCLLDETGTADSAKPVATLHPMPPRPGINGQWPSACRAPLVLRETHATAPTASVLERCLPKLHLGANGRVSVLGVMA